MMPEKNDPQAQWNWNLYYKSKSNLIPRETLLIALEFFEKENIDDGDLIANDIGCGHGSDTLELLKRGWKVNACDSEPEALSILQKSILPEWKSSLTTNVQSFENLNLSLCRLLNASYAIPFCHPVHFAGLWNKIEKSINMNGRFAGNFFGSNDSWAANKAMTFHTKAETIRLLDKFEIEFFNEKDEDGCTATCEHKHWHVFSAVARKIKD